MNNWEKAYRKANPVGRPKADNKRPPLNATVHHNVKAFFDTCEKEYGINPGRMVDKLVSEKYAHVKVEK